MNGNSFEGARDFDHLHSGPGCLNSPIVLDPEAADSRLLLVLEMKNAVNDWKSGVDLQVCKGIADRFSDILRV